MRKYIFVGGLFLSIIMATSLPLSSSHAQEDPFYLTCDGRVSFIIPADWAVVEEGGAGQVQFGSTEDIIDAAGFEVPGVYGALFYTERDNSEALGGEFADAQELLDSIIISTAGGDVTMSVGEMQPLQAITGEGFFVRISDGDFAEGIYAALETEDSFLVAFAAAQPGEFAAFEPAIFAMLESVEIAPAEESDFQFYFDQNCAFSVIYDKSYIANATLSGLYLYNNEEAVIQIFENGNQPESGMVAISVHSPRQLVEEVFYDDTIVLSSAADVMDYFLSPDQNYSVENNTVRGDYFATEVGGYPALRADLDLTYFDGEGEGLVLVVDLGGGNFAVVYAEAASGELADFEADIFAVADTIEFFVE